MKEQKRDNCDMRTEAGGIGKEERGREISGQGDGNVFRK